MAVTFTKSERRGPFTWRFEWTSDLGGTPTFYLYLDGVLIATTTATFRQIESEGGQFSFEVLDDTSAPTEVHPGYGLLSWQPDPDAEAQKYALDEWIVDEWIERRVMSVLGVSSLTHQTRFLEDETTHQFRLRPIPESQIDGTSKTVEIFMVRQPDAPYVTYAWDDGTLKVTITAA